jgi:MSHA biogenesis protein MshJ
LSQLTDNLNRKWLALAPRERWLVLLASLALVYAFANILLIEPANQKNQRLKTQAQQAQQQLQDLSTQVAELAQSPSSQLHKAQQAQMQALQTDISNQQVKIAQLEASLVQPTQMPQVLKDLMRTHQHVKLVTMQTFKPTPYLQVNPVESASNQVNNVAQQALYKHAFSITLSGQYLDLLHYAEAMQQLSKQVLWDKASLSTTHYPENELTLQLYTISLDKTWLSI